MEREQLGQRRFPHATVGSTPARERGIDKAEVDRPLGFYGGEFELL